VRERESRPRGRAFRFKIVYKSVVQTDPSSAHRSASKSRPPHRRAHQPRPPGRGTVVSMGRPERSAMVVVGPDVERDLNPHSHRRGPKPRQGPRAEDWPTSGTLTPAQQKEATRRRAQGATRDELARSYNVGISTIRRVTASR
jgi:hypothetical protein